MPLLGIFGDLQSRGLGVGLRVEGFRGWGLQLWGLGVWGIAL